MNFFYPNFSNDMWRIFGLLFFHDRDYFVDLQARRFRQEQIEDFLRNRGIALYDTACAVVRTKNTASDKDLEIVERTNLDELLLRIPLCTTIVTTGQKATDVACAHFGVSQPPLGSFVPFTHAGRSMRLYRMPSSSRAYPLNIQAKAERYAALLERL